MNLLVLVLIGMLFTFFTYFFWRWQRAHETLRETLQQVVELLHLKNAKYQRYPTPMISGDYFGHHLTVDGSFNKGHRFIVTVALPHRVSFRLFLLHEDRKTSLKPIAGLKLVTTPCEPFNHRFLVLSNRPDLCGAVFREYVCEKLLLLQEQNWQLDIFDCEAHIEIHQETPDARSLTSCLNAHFELLNNMLVANSAAI